MTYSVTIRENATGETVDYALDDLEWFDGSLFWWTEGNFGCDCNRRMCFLRAKGVAEDSLPEGGCGKGAFTVLHAVLPTGQKIELDRLERDDE